MITVPNSRSNKSSLALVLIAILVAASTLSGCTKGKTSLGTDENYDKTRQGANDPNAPKVLSEANGELLSEITDNTRATTIQGLSGSAAAGSSVSFPAGSLSIGTQVRVGEGSSIAGDLAAGDLGLGSNSLQSGGSALAVLSPNGGALGSPMSLSLPLGASLMLDSARTDLLVVIYKVVAADGSVKIGLLPRGDLALINNAVNFSIKYFGVFQIAYTSQLVSVKKESASATPILTANEAGALPPLIWQVRSPLLVNESKVAFAAALIGVSGVNKCNLIVDADKAEPWDTVGEINVQGTTVTVPTKEYTRVNNGAHTVHGMFKCRATDGRESSSPWMTHVFAAVNMTPPLSPAVAGPVRTASSQPTWTWSSGGQGGSGAFRYKLDDADLSAGASSSTLLSFQPASTLTDGAHTLYVQESNQNGNWSVNGSKTIIVDTTPPPALTGATATMGSDFGTVNISLVMPGSISDYANIEVRRLAGTTAPAATCNSDFLVSTVTNFINQSFLDTGLTQGATYSYRFCIRDTVGNLNNVATATTTSGSFTAFVTSASFDGNLKAPYQGEAFNRGMDGADFRCQYAATAAGLSGFWRALLSDANTSAISRLNLPTPIFSTNGTLIANNKADLFAGTLQNAINWTESASAAGGVYAWTGTTSDGSSGTVHCSNWGNNTGGAFGRLGYASSVGAQWTDYCSGLGTCDCSVNSNRLYCFKQKAPGLKKFSGQSGLASGSIKLSWNFFQSGAALDPVLSRVDIREKSGTGAPADNCTSGDGSTVVYSILDGSYVANSVTLGRSPSAPFNYRACVYDESGQLQTSHALASSVMGMNGKSLFVTNATFNGNLGGLGGADSLCTGAAANAGLTGVAWKAVLSDGSNDAIARLSTIGLVYTLTGSQIASGPTDFFNGSHPVQITTETMVNLSGSSRYVWSNFTTSGVKLSPSITNHCTNWSDNSVGGTGASSDDSLWASASWATSGGNPSCDTLARLYCMSQ